MVYFFGSITPNVVSAFGLTPYQIWGQLADGHDYQEVLDTVEKQGISLKSYQSVDQEVQNMLESPLVLTTYA